MASSPCFSASASSTRLPLLSLFTYRPTPFTSVSSLWIPLDAKKWHNHPSISMSSGASLLRRLSASSASPFDLSPPPIDHDLLETVAEDGAKVSEDGIVETFDNDDEALDAFDNGAVVLDLSHFGRIRVSGDDRIQFLHNQTTANFECLQDGQVLFD